MKVTWMALSRKCTVSPLGMLRLCSLQREWLETALLADAVMRDRIRPWRDLSSRAIFSMRLAYSFLHSSSVPAVTPPCPTFGSAGILWTEPGVCWNRLHVSG